VATRGSTVYADFIAEQLARQEQRKTSTESRGAAIVTTSGALATLLLGLAAVSKKNQGSKGTFVLPDASQSWLKLALIFFALAALGAVMTNLPLWLQWVDPDSLKELVANSWDDSAAEAEKQVAEARLDTLASLQSSNDLKGWVVLVAGICQVLAIAFIAVAVWVAF